MGHNLGGSKVKDNLDKIRETLTEYFGQQNELSNGLSVKNPLEKPDVLLEYERSERYGVAYYDGGLQDQPHLWLLEQDAVRDIVTLFSNLPSLTIGADK